jgi:fatty-acyl-CoA synthase
MPGADMCITPFMTRAAALYPDTELVSRTAEGRHRYTYANYADRTAQLAHALKDHGVERRDRLGTFAYNHYRHYELYFGIPGIGAQFHTINPLLPRGHIDYIVGDAADQWVFVDPPLLETLEDALAPDTAAAVEQFVVLGDTVPETELQPAVAYESLIADQPTDYDWPALPEDLPASMCYTSGTTGRPKGVEYTHKMLWAHVMASLTPMGYHVDETDTILSGVPMFHVNAVDSPFFGAAAGAKQVFGGVSPDPADWVELIIDEGVTFYFGIPTTCRGIIEHVEANDLELPSLERVQVGADSVSPDLIERYEERGIEMVHGWGMTEALPLTTASYPAAGMADWGAERRREKRTKIGRPLPGVEFDVLDDDGDPVPWDGETYGELVVRGPWITTEYYNRPAKNESAFDDGWLHTGDVVTVDEHGYLDLVDRRKYLIKSGGEWISTMQLEKALETHEHVARAAVIGVDDERWGERPVAYVVAAGAAEDELTPALEALVEAEFPKWWCPDEFVYVESLPRTATGKVSKMDLEQRYEAHHPSTSDTGR